MVILILLVASLLSFGCYAVSLCESIDGNVMKTCYTKDNSTWTSVSYDTFPYLCNPLVQSDIPVAPGGSIVFPSAIKGAQVKFSYNPQTVSSGVLSCQFVPGVPGDALVQRMEGGRLFSFITKEFYDVEDGWININDKVRMKATANRCPGGCSSKLPIDLAEMTGTDVEYAEYTIMHQPGDMTAYLWGDVTLELRKSVYDGELGLEGLKLYSVGYLYDRTITSTAMPTEANSSYSVVLSSGEITIPSDCVINDDSDFNLDFGLVQNNKIDIDGRNYNKPLSVNYTCKSPLSTDVTLRILGNVSSSSDDYFSTSNLNVNVKIEKKDGTLVKPNTGFTDKLVSGTGHSDFTVSLVAPSDDAVIATGDFSASLVMEMTIN